MDNKSGEQILIVKSIIESNRKFYNDKMKKLIEELTWMIPSMMDQIKISEYSPDQKYSPKAQYPTPVVQANKRAQ